MSQKVIPIDPATRASRKNDKSAQTRRNLIRQALQAISEHGVESTSVLQVAQKLGISHGTFCYHFQNLGHLLEEVGHMIAAMLRLTEGSDKGDHIDKLTATDTLALLGVPLSEAQNVVEKELETLESELATLDEELLVGQALGNPDVFRASFNNRIDQFESVNLATRANFRPEEVRRTLPYHAHACDMKTLDPFLPQ